MNKLKLICECNVGTYEYNNECVSICPAPTLVSSDNKKCISNL